jgi:hypothetical protein
MTSYFVSSNKELGTIDFKTGRISVSNITKNTYTDIAINISGEIYASTFDALYKLTLSNGVLIEAPVLTFATGNINGLEFARDGRLFASGEFRLYEISLSTDVAPQA